ncbi:hypothetical protein AVEN_157926-1 [Araneus ventricosus]|uniref:Uncharacterized protein n=1 Tax=Araneus ventricosus TaxID=182803 RepID=A0A4Y2H873_ARAVE|nr:hypothetical protein AVEN_157926-1 [Araneus ventricosus]
MFTAALASEIEELELVSPPSSISEGDIRLLNLENFRFYGKYMWCQTGGIPRHSRRASSGSKEKWLVDVLTSRRDVRKRRLLQRRLRRRECV